MALASVAASSSVLPGFCRLLALGGGRAFFQQSLHVVNVVISSFLPFLDLIALLVKVFEHLSHFPVLFSRLSPAEIFLYDVAAPAVARSVVALAAVSLSSMIPSVSARVLVLMPLTPRTSFLMSESASPQRTTCLTISSQ